MFTIEVERQALLTVQIDGDSLKEVLEKLHKGEGDWDLGDSDMGDYPLPADIISVPRAGDTSPPNEKDDLLLAAAKVI